MSVLALWSIVPILLKPDALDGDATTMIGRAAADFVGYLAVALARQPLDDYQPFLAASRSGAETACRDSQVFARKYAWYVLPAREIGSCQQRLDDLRREWAQTETVSVVEVVERTCVAIGFDLVMTANHLLTADEYMLLYGQTHLPEIHTRMRPYMIGKTVRLLLLCGAQENAALQLLKAYLRAVVRYPLEEVTYRNWIHITDPDDVNYPALLRWYFSCDQTLALSAAGGDR